MVDEVDSAAVTVAAAPAALQQECLLHWLQFDTLTFGGGVFVQRDFRNTNIGKREVSGEWVRKYWKSSQAQKSFLLFSTDPGSGGGGDVVEGVVSRLLAADSSVVVVGPLLKNDRNNEVIATTHTTSRHFFGWWDQIGWPVGWKQNPGLGQVRVQSCLVAVRVLSGMFMARTGTARQRRHWNDGNFKFSF